ncbi:MAG: ABC transporter substrate-binding protein, partial [Magnetococcus sp. DMHC-6]
SVTQYHNREVDGLFDVFSNTILHVTAGFPTKVVYVVDYSYSGDVIVGRGDFSSLEDLKGHRISFEKVNSFSHLFVLKALDFYKLGESDVQFKVIPAHEVLSALDQGCIDAGHTWEPTTSQALAQGYKILTKAGDFPGIITDVLLFSAQTIKERPQEIQAVVNALLDAHAFLMTHREESIALMAEAEGISKAAMTRGVDGVAMLNLRGNIAAMSQGTAPTSLYVSGEFFLQFLLSRGQLLTVPTMDDLIEPQFIISLKHELTK